MHAALGYGVSIVSVAFMIFMNLLELLVAFIQAYVFTLLSALYFGLATAEPEHH
jgi:F-type H+-transporting ATPase subunit a